MVVDVGYSLASFQLNMLIIGSNRTAHYSNKNVQLHLNLPEDIPRVFPPIVGLPPHASSGGALAIISLEALLLISCPALVFSL